MMQAGAGPVGQQAAGDVAGGHDGVIGAGGHREAVQHGGDEPLGRGALETRTTLAPFTRA